MIRTFKGIVSALILTVGVCHAADSKLTAGWELWYPYQYTVQDDSQGNEQDKALTGLDIEIFKIIIQQAKLSVAYKELPWKRHVQQIESGDVQLAMGASKSDQRSKFSYFSLPYRTETVKLFVPKGKAIDIKLNSLERLSHSKYMIGIEGGYYYGEKYQRLSKSTSFQSHINEVIDIEQNINLLNKGHIDGFLADPVTLAAYIKQHKLEQEFEAHPLEIYQTDIHIMLSKKSTSFELLNTINEAILSLKETNKIKPIIKKWTQH
jgi:polar amino acid transport system substrate-binding protein